MAEDDHWLNLTNEEEESYPVAHIYLMARIENDISEDAEEKANLSDEQKLKFEKDRVASLEKDLKMQQERYIKLNSENAGSFAWSPSLLSESKRFTEKTDILNKELSELHDKLKSLELVNDDLVVKKSTLTLQNKVLNEKLKDVEEKLYKRGQTDQTIFQNKPTETINPREGLGYENPNRLKKTLYFTPTIYKCEYLDLGPDYQIRFMKSSEEVEKQEDLNRQRKDKMQVPFYYTELNES
ncbi:rho-associated protein kinase 1-like [Cynara cardunculus var. scolymus]|uniref:rho-associated protein kinase 1-like n=1 Tax=Cynara cardunculus var. scolymus TaxID=59895 RepID=UPI000D62C374|nr:rho-associated protein kinase 1-like [Cynara cardunculus var. scolymus]